MKHPGDFDLVVVPEGNVDVAVDLYQRPNGTANERRRVVGIGGWHLQAVSDHLMEALRSGGYRPSEIRRNRTKPLRLPEPAGVRLGLVLLATKPLRKVRRIEEISSAVRTMSEDEAYYWFAKCTDKDRGRRAQRAFRDLWSDR